MRSLPIWLIWIALVFATFATLNAGCGATDATVDRRDTTAKWDQSHWDDAAWAQ